MKRQLEEQASAMVSEINDSGLTDKILSTCLALLNTAEQIEKNPGSKITFELSYTGYLSISGKVKSFYDRNRIHFSEKDSEVLRRLIGELSAAEEANNAITKKIRKLESNIRTEKETTKQNEARAEELQKELKDAAEEKQKAADNVSELERNNRELKEEIEKCNKQKERLIPESERLVEEANKAKETYAELLAYYPELERIQAALKIEGLVDVESFTDKIQDMNVNGNNLISEYDRILGSINEDIRSLEEKIKKHQSKAGLRA